MSRSTCHSIHKKVRSSCRLKDRDRENQGSISYSSQSIIITFDSVNCYLLLECWVAPKEALLFPKQIYEVKKMNERVYLLRVLCWWLFGKEVILFGIRISPPVEINTVGGVGKYFS